MMRELRPLTNEIIDSLEHLAEEKENNITVLGKDVMLLGEKNVKTVIFMSIIVFVFGIVIAVITAASIKKPVVQVVEQMNGIADGDLSQEPINTMARDEIGKLVQATNKMRDENNRLIKQIRTSSETLSSQSEQLTQTAEEVKLGAEQISTTMVELATATEVQASSASDIASVMRSFTEKVEEANEKGEKIVQKSNRVLEMTNNGKEIMEFSMEQVMRICDLLKHTVEKMQLLDKHS